MALMRFQSANFLLVVFLAVLTWAPSAAAKPIIVFQGPFDDVKDHCKAVLDPEICDNIFGPISGLMCAYSGSGVGDGLSPVVVNPGRKAYGVADNAIGALPGDYDGYSGYELVC